MMKFCFQSFAVHFDSIGSFFLYNWMQDYFNNYNFSKAQQ